MAEKTEEESSCDMVLEVPKLQMVFATIILCIILLLSVSLIGKLSFLQVRGFVRINGHILSFFG
jgi:hypothetical protein